MLLAYIDEFGHIGPYIAAEHPKFNNHPVFGYAGFIIPAQNVRQLSGAFEFHKENLLRYEIEKVGAHPRRWEKKGASLLTTRNMRSYGDEIRPVLRRLMKRLRRLNGKVVFVGQLKPLGSASETGESSTDRSSHVLRQVILEVSKYAESQNEDVLIFLDSVDTKARLEALSVSASFIYSSTSHSSVRRVLEAPMQLESHLYGTTQFADWLCALLSRVTHFHLVQGSEFEWAPKLLNYLLEGSNGSVTQGSRIQKHHARQGKDKLIKVGSLIKDNPYYLSAPGSNKALKANKFTQTLENHKTLKNFYQSLKSK